MIKILPAINTKTFEEVKEKINILKDLTKEFHIDISSLEFANYETWNNPKELDRLETDIKIHLHLMIKLKPQEILKWNNSRIKSFFLHIESTNLPDAFIRLAKKTKKELFIVWSKNVEKELIKKYVKFFNGILVLCVDPGKSGQEINKNSYQRIEIAKGMLNENQKLGVDGGINEENFRIIKNFKPHIIVIGSAIFDTKNPKDSYLKFLNLAKV